MKTTRRLLASLVMVSAALSVAACDNNPTKDKATATVAEPVAVASSAQAGKAPAAGTTKYAFSNADSKINFVGAKVTKKHDGSFGAFSGTIDYVDANVEKSAVSVDITMDSLTSDDPKLTGHLKTPDLFDTAKFPKAKFASTSIKAGGEKGATHTITGNLELHGVTKSISFPATIKPGEGSIDVTSEFGINRKDFGVVYPGMPDDLIKDEILLKLDIHAKKAAS